MDAKPKAQPRGGSERFADELRRWIASLEVDQRAFAEQLGFDHTSLSKVLKGHRPPPRSLLARVLEQAPEQRRRRLRLAYEADLIQRLREGSETRRLSGAAVP